MTRYPLRRKIADTFWSEASRAFSMQVICADCYREYAIQLDKEYTVTETVQSGWVYCDVLDCCNRGECWLREKEDE